MKVLFVCTGNTCRSPIAEGIYNTLAEGGSSRGLMAQPGEMASENAIKAMDKMGIDIKYHKAKQLTKKDIEESELVLTMTKGHKAAVVAAVPEAKDKVYTIGEYVGGGDVSDPYGGDEACYEACAKELYEYIERVIKKQNDN